MANKNKKDLVVSEWTEFIKDKLYFVTLSGGGQSKNNVLSDIPWKNDTNLFYLDIDETLVYENFFNDFGPLNLAMVYRFCTIIRQKLKLGKKVIHCTSGFDQKKRSNAAVLICAYMIIEHNWTAYQTYMSLSQNRSYQFIEFRDASCLKQTEYYISIEDCLNALYKAKWYGFFNFNDFDLEEYEKYETVKDGDINWIVPGSLLAFSSPHSRDYIDKSGYHIHSPAYYYKYFTENNVNHVVRLNNKNTYDAKQTFVASANINHTDLFFPDGTPPTDVILLDFLSLCEQYLDEINIDKCTDNQNALSNCNSSTSNVLSKAIKGAIAVHCKAGLGRTGCLIASYIVKHWSFTALEAIAWIRICRPGSVIGIQQQWLVKKQSYLLMTGEQWRHQIKHSEKRYKRFINGIYSVKRHATVFSSYSYTESPPLSSFIYNYNELDNDTSESTIDISINNISANTKNQFKTSPIIKKKMKISDFSNNILNSKEHQISMYSKSDSKRKIITPSKLICHAPHSLITPKKSSVTPAIVVRIARSSSKASITAKSYSKSQITTNPNTRITRSPSTKTKITKVSEDSKPSYALATVSSNARVSRRLRQQNIIKK
ncbi:dual specificity protein phosphatase CDC14C isoform X1 [Daktulosphaira vitifoliae]|uniref:dual specificity protein phosphatase CDC14C isoform X1 n=1 Tax=Daktulosphaira vitifoliae TaxID=58002 RepID=UPI0021AB0251|nr:dual specificity protein phosphatase CDC14C isoform X1 [Daktulosphaira vitifoliae]